MDCLNEKYPIIPKALPLGRLILHSIVLVLGWIIFFVFTYTSILHGDAPTFRFIGIYMFICATVIPLFTYLWIRHNVHIYKHKGPRHHIPDIEESYVKDWFGMPIVADREKIKTASKITINLSDGKKIYELS